MTAATLIAMAAGPVASAAPVGSGAPHALRAAAAPAAAAGPSGIARSATLRAAAPAAPAGQLTTQGCAFTAGVASCDLYAMVGSVSILGSATPTPIWGFSSTGAAGSATAPGPVLVVHQGDDVTISLHNTIDGQQVSLALPGQAAVVVDAVPAGDDRTGVASGSSRTYSFNASRAGTFLYEAGHTDNGTRQVAMGLAGALIVLPTTGAPYPSVNDDSVLVLSEIDPALNRAPATFDMRNFHPAYRLINGKPFPSSDEVSTDQGHTVLVRYVNVGAQSHPMSVLGATQTEVAQDGHPMAYPMTVTAETVDPGMTLDTLVTMPTGPEAKVAVYEAAMHLDNNGQNNGNPTQLAFGGMMTFLDTNAPPASTDGVGPVSSHLTVSPNPSNGAIDVTVTADLSDVATGNSGIDQAEYVIDDAVTTAPGFGVPMTGAFAAPPAAPTMTVAGVTGTIPATPGAGHACSDVPAPVALSCLDAGKHLIYVRAHDLAGNWGVIGSVVFNLPKSGPQTTNGSLSPALTNAASDITVSTTGDDSAAGKTITNAEYFLDKVGADGSGAALALNNAAATVVSEDATIPAAALATLGEGVHEVFVHSRDSLGLWGPPLDLPLTLDLTGPKTLAASVAPNPTNGVLSDLGNPGNLAISAQFSDLDAGGKAQHKIVAAEAFFNLSTGATPDPGSGLQLLAVSGAFGSDPLHPNVDAAYGLIPLSEFNGLADKDYVVSVRAQDEAGNWGNLFPVKITVDKTAPVLGALTATPNPTLGVAQVDLSATYTEADTLAGSEYWIGNTDPGVGNATSAQIALTTNADGTVKTVTAPGISLAGLRGGRYQVNLRVVDRAGNWSAPVATTVTVTPFLTGTLTATPNPTNGAGTISLSATVQVQNNGLVGAEYWTGNRDPGLGKATARPVTVAGGRATITGVDVSRLPTGTTTFTMRVQDSSGRWSNNVTGNVVIRQNLIFASTFQNTTLGDWTARTGLVTSATAAFLRSTPALENPLSTRGLRVAIPAATGPRASYLTDGSAAAETQYFARFLFNPNTLNSGAAANVLTVFEARAATGQAFAVQFHRAGAASQVRVVLDRNGTLTPVVGAWVTIGTGTKRLDVSWSAAATTAGSGSVTLKVNGVAGAPVTGTNSQRRIDSVNLGVPAGVVVGAVGVGTTGIAYFDSFTSTRFTAPQ